MSARLVRLRASLGAVAADHLDEPAHVLIYRPILGPIRIKGLLTFAAPSQAERQILAGRVLNVCAAPNGMTPDHSRICMCSFVLRATRRDQLPNLRGRDGALTDRRREHVPHF
jgi:hypothetical protein